MRTRFCVDTRSITRTQFLYLDLSALLIMSRGAVILFAVQRDIACIHLNVIRLAKDLCNLFERDAFRLLRKDVSTDARCVFCDD